MTTRNRFRFRVPVVPRVSVPVYLLVMVVLVPGLFSAMVLLISLRTNQHAIEAERSSQVASDQAMCQLVSILDDAYKGTPPSTETGRRVAEAMHSLRVASRCP